MDSVSLHGSITEQKEWQLDIQHRGWTTLPFLSEEAVDALRECFESSLKQEMEGTHVTMFNPDPEYRRRADEQIQSFLKDRAEKLFPGYRVLYGNFMVKEPGPAGIFPVHQDWTYVDEQQFRSYAIWIPLQKTDMLNGTLSMVSGSHRMLTAARGPYVHEPFAEISSLIRSHYGTPVNLNAGEAVIWDHRVIHFSNPNYTPHPRLAVTVILVPIQAEVIHCFKEENQAPQHCHVYQISREFFYHYRIGSKPEKFAKWKAELTVPDHSFTAEEFRQLYEQFSLEQYRTQSETVAQYYDQWQVRYDEIYGKHIQAFRPDNDDELLKCWIEGAQLESGQRVLDAGCGTAGPACTMAEALNLQVDGVTVSPVQVELAQKRIKDAGLSGKVKVVAGDYHHLSQIFSRTDYDRVLFLESLGHAGNPEQVIREAFRVLKPGGKIYIKDFYKKVPEDPEFAVRVNQVIEAINRLYCYRTLDLNTTLLALRKVGFEIAFVRKFSFKDDIGIRFRFEEKFGIDIFGGLPEFAPAEWLEILCTKPVS